MEMEPELERPSWQPIVLAQAVDEICGENAAKEGPRGGALWGSRIRPKTKKSLKLAA